jgi:hypothetical protein
LKLVAAEDLPELGDPLPLLEDGTLKISPTVNMKVLPRRSSYICGFYFGEPSSPPRLLLTAEPSDVESLGEVTQENLAEFAQRTEARLAKSNTKPLEAVLPMVIGGKPCVRYVLASRFKQADVDRQILETIHDDKLYRLDLQVYRGQILTYRDDAYAVFAGMEFLPPAPSAQAAEGEANEAPPPTEDSGS